MKNGDDFKKRFLNKKTKENHDNKENYDKKGNKIKKILNRYTIIGLVVGFLIGIIFMSSSTTEAENSYEEQKTAYESQISDKERAIENYEDKIKDYESQIDELNEKVEEAQPWFEMKEEERKAEEEKLAKQKEEEQKQKEAEEKAAKEAQEKKEAEEKAAKEKKEKQGYNTGITYKQLARTPDDYMFEKVKFEGKVIQVMESGNTVQIRLAVGGDYDNILLGEYDSSIVSSRVLEDDYITIYGLSSGLITYTSTMGASITIPGVMIDKIDM